MIGNYSSGWMICASYDSVNLILRVHFKILTFLSPTLPSMYFKRLVRKVPNINSIVGSKYYPVWLYKWHALTYLIMIATVNFSLLLFVGVIIFQLSFSWPRDLFSWKNPWRLWTREFKLNPGGVWLRFRTIEVWWGRIWGHILITYIFSNHSLGVILEALWQWKKNQFL